jgi:hypothetical protein
MYNVKLEINLASTEKEYKGICNKCQQPIVGKLEGVQTADGVFHSKCFTCEGCQKDIPSSTSYYVHPVQGKPYHIDCYEVGLHKIYSWGLISIH